MLEAAVALPFLLLLVGGTLSLLMATSTWILAQHAAEENLLCRSSRESSDCAEELDDFFKRTRLALLRPEVKCETSLDHLVTSISFRAPLAMKIRVRRSLRRHLTDNLDNEVSSWSPSGPSFR